MLPIFFIFLSSLLFCSCPNPLVVKVLAPKTVTFETNGGSRVESQTVYRDYPIKRPSNPVRNGFTFDAWYSDNGIFAIKWNFDTVPDNDITLYANWKTGGESDKTIITTVAITVTGPATGETPDTSASGTGNYTIGQVTWSPDHNPFQGGMVYTASVTLTADQDHTFAAELTAATVNGNNATVTGNTANALTLSYTFAETSDKAVTAIAVKTQPAQLTYTHGGTLDLAGLVVTLTYNDSTTEDVALGEFVLKNISTNPSNGEVLSRMTHDNQPVTVSYGSLTMRITGNLTVNPRAITLTVDPIPAQTYNGSALTPQVTVKDDTAILTLTADYTVEYADNINAGTAAVTITGAGNYAGSSGSATFTINRAAGADVAAPPAATVGVSSVTLAAVTMPATGQSVEYGFNTSNTAPTSGWQTSTTFNGLTAGTVHYFFARSASSSNYETGAASAGTRITTMQQAGDDTIVSYWVDDTGAISIGTEGQPVPGNTVTITNGGSVTFSVGGGGYSDHSWTLNGTPVGTGESYTFDTSDNDKESGRNYTIGLLVQKDGKYYFTEITIRIEE